MYNDVVLTGILVAVVASIISIMISIFALMESLSTTSRLRDVETKYTGSYAKLFQQALAEAYLFGVEDAKKAQIKPEPSIDKKA